MDLKFKEDIKLELNIKKYSYSIAVFLLFVSISLITACDQRESARQVNPDNSPPSSPGDGGPISTPPDSAPTGGDDTPGSGGSPGGSGGGGGTPGDDDDDDMIMDDPTPPIAGTGIIRGMVQSSGGTDLNGVHVRAVNVDNTNLQISSFSGIDCDLVLLDGEFCIQNVPAGTYRVLIERLDGSPAAFQTNRYSDFISNEVTTLVFPDEYWNGANESSTDDVMEVETIVVMDGATVNGIDFITND